MIFHSIDIGNTQPLRYTEWGNSNKPAVIFIHGLGSLSAVWHPVAMQLQENYHCIGVDMPGYGNSPTVDDFSIPFYIACIEKLITQLNLTDVTLVGHSMGGQVCIGLSLRIAPVVSKLVLVSPAGLERFSWMEQQMMQNGMNMLSGFTGGEGMMHGFVNQFSILMNEDWQHYTRILLDWAKSVGDDNCRKAILQSVDAMLNYPVHEHISALSVPTKIVFGERDEFIPNKLVHPFLTVQKLVHSASKKVAQFKGEIFPNCGHFSMLEQVEATARFIRE